MRIITGTHKNRQIPFFKNFSSRPSTDFTKEALFNILSNLYDLNKCKVLDLFAGTGSISYEFASNKAKEIVAVDIEGKNLSFINKNLELFGFNCVKLMKIDAIKFIEKFDGKFDIIFADPPYNYLHTKELVNKIFEYNLLEQSGMLIIEHPKAVDFSDNLYFKEKRHYGKCFLSFFSLK